MPCGVAELFNGEAGTKEELNTERFRLLVFSKAGPRKTKNKPNKKKSTILTDTPDYKENRGEVQ